MATETIQKLKPTLPPCDDPYFYGWRMVRKVDQNGNEKSERVALTEWDVLHPQEEDFIVQTFAHINDCRYLNDALHELCRGRPDMIVFQDMRIDWQLDEYSILGPDIVVFENLNAPWDPGRGTFPVKSMGARALFAIEVISPSTEKLDKNQKVGEYERVGVPLYIIVDREEESDQWVVKIYGYRMTPHGFERIPDDPKGIWIEPLRIWISSAGNKVVCFDESGIEIPDYSELAQQRNNLLKVSAQEKQRAEESARRVTELEAELRRLRGDFN